MIPRLFPFLICATLAQPVVAMADGVQLTILNTSARAVTGLSVYPVDATSGAVIDDNLGTVLDPIAAGSTGKLELALLECQVVFLRATFEDGEEVTGTTDLCQSRTIGLHD